MVAHALWSPLGGAQCQQVSSSHTPPHTLAELVWRAFMNACMNPPVSTATSEVGAIPGSTVSSPRKFLTSHWNSREVERSTRRTRGYKNRLNEHKDGSKNSALVLYVFSVMKCDLRLPHTGALPVVTVLTLTPLLRPASAQTSVTPLSPYVHPLKTHTSLRPSAVRLCLLRT